MMMKNTFISTETVRMGAFHPVQKLYSFLDIPRHCLFAAPSFNASKELQDPCAPSAYTHNHLNRTVWSDWQQSSVLETTQCVENATNRLGSAKHRASTMLGCGVVA